MQLTNFYTKVDKDLKQCTLTIVSDDNKLNFTLEHSHILSLLKELQVIKSDFNDEECRTHSDGFKLAIAKEMLQQCLDASYYPKMVCEVLGIYTKSRSEDQDSIQRHQFTTRDIYLDKLIRFSKTLPEHEEMMKITKQQLGKE